MTDGPRVMLAGLDLLDRQIVDPEGNMAGKVDDLELEDRHGEPPVVVAILAGPGALAHQLGGAIGRWLESVQQRLHPDEQPGPARIPFTAVSQVNNHVEVTADHEALDTHRVERWARDHVISHIPGSGHAPE